MEIAAGNECQYTTICSLTIPYRILRYCLNLILSLDWIPAIEKKSKSVGAYIFLQRFTIEVSAWLQFPSTGVMSPLV